MKRWIMTRLPIAIGGVLLYLLLHFNVPALIGFCAAYVIGAAAMNVAVNIELWYQAREVYDDDG